MDGAALSAPTLLRFSRLVLDALGAARDELDALNVYPIPDGDTGTNLFLTFEAGHAALEEVVADRGGEEAVAVEAAAAAYSRGLLLGARGNSGVIMSQLVGAFLKRLGPTAGAEDGPVLAEALAEALSEATVAAYAAVGEPVEGTVLSVARAAADAAQEVAGTAEVGTVATAVVAAAEAALVRTTSQLATLQRAGVVDAGGKGLCIVLRVAAAALTGQPAPRPHRSRPGPGPAVASAGWSPVVHPTCAEELPGEEGPAFEVMYLLDAEDAAVPELRARLLALGDSLVVVGGDGLWNVHVHVDDVGAALEAGLACGRPHRVRVTHFRDELRKRSVEPAAGSPTSAGPPGAGPARVVVAVAYADGLAALFEQAGAQVVRATSGPRPGSEQLLAAARSAARATGAGEVVLLTNDRDVVPAAEAAASLAGREDGTRVAVVPTRAQVQGLAALAVHESTRSFERDLVEMTAAARHARTGAVSVATETERTAAGPCHPGDVLGEVEGEVTVVGRQLERVAVEVLDRLLGGGGELVTVVAGAGAGELARLCEEHVRDHHPTVEVVGYDGGQERFALLFGVE